MPGTSGQIRLDIDEIRLEKLKEKQDSLWAKEGTDDFNVESAKAMDLTVKSLQTYLSKERWRQFGLAAFLYAILGAFFAALLSGGVLEALLIGAGWTAYLGAIGLKKSNEERGAYKDRLIEDLTHQGNKQEVVIGMLEDRLIEVASLSPKPSPPKPPEDSRKSRQFYVIRKGGIKTPDHYLVEGNEEDGPWYPPGKYEKEEIDDWYKKGWIQWAYI